MTLHDLWHVAVLGATLLGAGGLAIALVGPLVFEEPPPGWPRTKRLAFGGAAGAALLLFLEWLGVH